MPTASRDEPGFPACFWASDEEVKLVRHEEMLAFDLYARACTESRLMCLWLVNHIEASYGLRPFASTSGYVQWNPNFALVQTVGVRVPNLTINLSGPQERYRGIGVDHLLGKPWRGLTRLRMLDTTSMPELLAAVDHSYRIKARKASSRSTRSTAGARLP